MRRSFTWITAGAALSAVAKATFHGDGTTYSLGGQVSAGNCNLMSHPPDAVTNYAALNGPQWESTMNCGRCAQVTCVDDLCAGAPQKSEIVYIVDSCKGCKHGDLDLSPSVFKSLTGIDPARVKIEWSFVDCPIKGNIEYCAKSGSSPYWLAVQPTNMVSGVKSLTVNGMTTAMVDSAFYFLFDGDSEDTVALSQVTISMTSTDGEEITDTVALVADTCTKGGKQFAGGSPASFVAATVDSTPTTLAQGASAPATSSFTETPAPTPSPSNSADASSEQTPAPTTATPAPTTAAPSPTPATPAPSSATPEPSHAEKSTGASRSTDGSTPYSGDGKDKSSSGSESSDGSSGSLVGTTASSAAEAGVDPSAGQTPTPTPTPTPTTVSTKTDSAGMDATALVISLSVLVAIALGVVALLIFAVRKKKAFPDKTDDRMPEHSDLEHGESADASGVFSAASTPSNSHRLV